MKIFKSILTVVLLIALLLLGMWLPAQFTGRAQAATDNPSTASPGYQIVSTVVTSISGTTSGIWKIKAPWPFRVMSFVAVQPTNYGQVFLDLKNQAGTSLLSSTMSLSTVVTEATFTTAVSQNITDETTLQVDTSNTGTAGNVTLQLNIKRL